MRRLLAICAAAAVATLLVTARAGAASAPLLIRDINPAGPSNPTELTVVGSTVFFAANDGVHGNELWKTDGTAAGTKMVKNIRSGAKSSDPQNLVNVNGKLFFTADDGAHGRELWKSNGTAAGTKMVKNIMPEPAPPYHSDGLYIHEHLTAIGSKVIFFNEPLYGNEPPLWVSDGTAAGTKQLIPYGVWLPDSGEDWWRDWMTGIGAANGKFYFVASDETGPGYHLWTSDGTVAGTHIVPGSPSADQMSIFPANGAKLYFYADGRVWRTNGTALGTKALTKVGDVHAPETAVLLAGRLYFGESGIDGALWRTDGSVAGTKKVIGGAVADLATAGGRLFWSSHGLETSDGTAAGTEDLKSFSGGWPTGLVGVGAKVCFTAYDPDPQLWLSDGTLGGTYEVKPFTGLAGKGVAQGVRFVFAADDGVHGTELWSYSP